MLFSQSLCLLVCVVWQAYYVPNPSAPLLPVTATSAQVQAYLAAQMLAMYPLYQVRTPPCHAIPFHGREEATQKDTGEPSLTSNRIAMCRMVTYRTCSR
jgi:hypothetical protein